MRTSLDIDEDVLRAARELALLRHSTTGRILSELARRALTASGSDDITETPACYGFRPFARRGGVVTDADIERLRGVDAI